MGAGSAECEQCGERLADDARYCPACGLPRDSPLLDPLGVEAGAASAEPAPAPRTTRVGVLAGVAAVAAAVVLLGWGLSGGGADDPPADDADRDEEAIARDDFATTTTTAEPTTTTSPPSTTEEPEPEQLFVNGTPGPVLEPGVQGALVATRFRALDRIDLATGEITTIELDQTPEPSGYPLVVGGLLVTPSTPGVIATDLATGAQRVLVQEQNAEGGYIGVAGPAGDDSVWVQQQSVDFASVIALEVGLEGEVRRALEFDPPLWFQFGRGRDLYLDTPTGTWIYDADTAEVVTLPGRMGQFDQNTMLLTHCQTTLECQVELDVGGSFVPLPEISAQDYYGGLGGVAAHLSPDGSTLILTRFTGGVDDESSVLDLATGERTDLGDVGMEPWQQPVWIPGTPWVLGHGAGQTDAVALNTDTGDVVELDLGLGSRGVTASSMLVFDPSR